jgi:[ribosomal protein S5]-alanine N-acetyltransferase
LIRVDTRRLTLVAATAELARADAGDHNRFSALIGADLPEAWPPEVMRDAQDFFARKLESGVPPGWWHWYALLKGPGRPIVIGTAGFAGPPNSEGIVTLGYSVLDAFAGCGYATEMVMGILQWLAAAGGVKHVYATTFEQHHPSVRVLMRSGFVCKGVSSEDAAADSDRHGRGRLMLFVREMP